MTTILTPQNTDGSVFGNFRINKGDLELVEFKLDGTIVILGEEQPDQWVALRHLHMWLTKAIAQYAPKEMP